MRSKAKRKKWWKNLTKEQQSAYVEKAMAAKAAKRTPEYRRLKYKAKGYSDEGIELIMKGGQ